MSQSSQQGTTNCSNCSKPRQKFEFFTTKCIRHNYKLCTVCTRVTRGKECPECSEKKSQEQNSPQQKLGQNASNGFSTNEGGEDVRIKNSELKKLINDLQRSKQEREDFARKAKQLQLEMKSKQLNVEIQKMKLKQHCDEDLKTAQKEHAQQMQQLKKNHEKQRTKLAEKFQNESQVKQSQLVKENEDLKKKLLSQKQELKRVSELEMTLLKSTFENEKQKIILEMHNEKNKDLLRNDAREKQLRQEAETQIKSLKDKYEKELKELQVKNEKQRQLLITNNKAEREELASRLQREKNEIREKLEAEKSVLMEAARKQDEINRRSLIDQKEGLDKILQEKNQQFAQSILQLSMQNSKLKELHSSKEQERTNEQKSYERMIAEKNQQLQRIANEKDRLTKYVQSHSHSLDHYQKQIIDFDRYIQRSNANIIEQFKSLDETYDEPTPEKLKMAHLLIKQYKDIVASTKHPQLVRIITQKQTMVSNYVASEMIKSQKALQELDIRDIHYTRSEKGLQFKRFIQKINFFRSINNQNINDNIDMYFHPKLIHKLKTLLISHHQKIVKCNNQISQLDLIKETDEFMETKEFLHQEFPIHYQPCQEEYKSIQSNIKSSFDRFKGTYEQIKQNKPAQKLEEYLNKAQQLKRFMQVVDHAKNYKKYKRSLQDQLQIKVEDIKITLLEILNQNKKTLKTKLDNLIVTRVYFDCYLYQKIFKKLKVFDQILSKEENNFYNLNFTQLYNKIINFLRILKQEKINLCDVLITEDKIIVADLQREFQGISFDQSIRIRYSYKLKNVLQNRNATLNKLSPNSIITNKHLQQFQAYFFEANQLSTIKVINQLPEISQQFKLFSSKMIVIVDYLEFKFKECYGNSTQLKQMDYTKRTIRHFLGFEQFVQKNFQSEHIQFKKRIVPIKYSYLPQPQSYEECMFSMLLRLNTANQTILQQVVNTPELPLKEEHFDYYTNLITYLPKVEGSKVQGKLHCAVSQWISQLQGKEWLQGETNSASERKMLFHINKLQNKEIAYYRQFINIHKNRIIDERQRIINSEKRKLKQQDFDHLQAFLVECQKTETNNSKFNKLYVSILEEYMNYSYDSIVNDIHKKTNFLQTIYKLTISDHSRSVREIFRSKEHKIYFCRPELSSLKNNIVQIEQFQGENDSNLGNMSQALVNVIKLYSIFKANEGKSLLDDKERQKLTQEISGITQGVLGNYLNLCRHLEHQKILQQKCNRKKLFVDLIKIQAYGRIMKKWQQFLPHHEYYNNRALYEQILQKMNAKIQRAYEQVRQFRFYKDQLKLQYDNSHFLFEHLKRVERVVQIFKEIKYRLFKLEDFLKNNYLQGLHLKNISPKELVSIVQMSWIKQYTLLKKQISELFASPQLDIVLKYKMILSQKEIVKNQNLLCFNEIIKEQYDFKRIVIDELMALQGRLERYELNLQKQYESFVLSQKKLDDKKKKFVESEKTRIKNKYDKLIADVQNSFHQIKDQAERQKKIQTEINTLVNQCRSEEELLLNQQASKMQKFRSKFTVKTDNIISKFFDCFLIIKKIQSNFDTQIEDICKKISAKIQAQMDKFQKGLKNIIINFAKKSKNSDMILGMGSLNLFKQINEEQFHLNTKAMNNIHEIIKKCPQTAKDQELSKRLVQAFDDYQTQLKRVEKQFLEGRSENRVMQVIKDTKSQARQLPPAVTIARIFAVYSIYRCIDSRQDQITFDGNPHIAQVVAILLLIDAHNGRNAKFGNRLIEVKTGEGKSRVLAGLNCYLALCGFDVYCGCYSSYLSQRDEEEFHSLFVRFGVEKMISYGPFSAHCQSVFNQGAKHNFKEVTKKVLLNEPLSTSNLEYLQRLNKLLKRESRVNRVLVIDEVDVFFDENYFGKLYAPGVAIDGPEVKRLIKFIWQNHSDKRLNRLVFQAEEYRNLINALPHLTELLKNQVQAMIHACNNWNVHPYQIRNNEIQYVDNDSVNSKLNFGYSTAFASCYEFERGKISEANYNKNINISLIIGQFSYAELPKYFDNIMGVSGTVEAMSDFRKKIMYEDYKVTDIYTLPSIYGDSHRKILGFHSCDKSEYLPYLLERIHEIRRTQRPILVFFQTQQQLNVVSNSPQFSQFTTNIYKITQKMPPEMRNPLINYAGTKNRITLISSAFSRGTDFTVYDSDINERGGMHVIQTYVSKNQSDFIQILGRTGRQGKNGSFQMIVTTQYLKTNQIPLVKDQQLSQNIRQSWKIHDVKHGRVLSNSIQDAQKLHEVTFQVVGSMSKQSSKLVNAVMKLNLVQIRGETIRTVIAIDGTGSMGAALNAVLSILNDTISRTDQIISMRMPNTSFQHKIMIYRNYNTSLDKILEQSNFSKDSEYLKAFMTSIKPEGGLGNEAHQVLFYDVGQQLQYDKIDQIIIIGDAPANKYEDMCKHRKKFRGDEYWNAKYPLLSSLEEYSLVVKSKKIPIHSFYILRRKQEEESIKWDKSVKLYFQALSNQTKGSFEQLNIRDKERSKDQLTDFISERVLELIGGRDLIELYSQMFSKRYV